MTGGTTSGVGVEGETATATVETGADTASASAETRPAASSAAETRGPFVLSADKRQRVAQLVEEMGLSKAARAMGVTREPLARLLGGLDVRRGTLALVEAALEKMGTSGELEEGKS